MDIDLILVTSLRLVDSMLHNKLQKWEFFSFCLSFVPKSLCNLSFAVCYQKSLQVGCCSLLFIFQPQIILVIGGGNDFGPLLQLNDIPVANCCAVINTCQNL